MHNPYANVKTHVQGKQVYVGLHHLVHILYCNQTLCVCVCSQDLKLVVKQTLELLAPSSFRNSETQNFIAYSLFLVSLFPRLPCWQLWLLLFLLQMQYKSRKKRRSNNNSKTQKTNKQKKPKKLKVRKFCLLLTLSNIKQYFQN